jgi:general stress protein 26
LKTHPSQEQAESMALCGPAPLAKRLVFAMNANDQNPKEHLRALLKKFHTAMLVTQTGIGELRARPMAITRIDDDCRIWFFSGKASGKMHELEDHSQVNIACQQENGIYLSISGRAIVNRDPAKIEELWNDIYKTWFPQGKDDPDLALISIEPEEGEYWDNEGFNKIKYLFETAKAIATGQRPHIIEGEQHAKVVLEGSAAH